MRPVDRRLGYDLYRLDKKFCVGIGLRYLSKKLSFIANFGMDFFQRCKSSAFLTLEVLGLRFECGPSPIITVLLAGEFSLQLQFFHSRRWVEPFKVQFLEGDGVRRCRMGFRESIPLNPPSRLIECFQGIGGDMNCWKCVSV